MRQSCFHTLDASILLPHVPAPISSVAFLRLIEKCHRTTWKEGGIGLAQIAGYTYFLKLLERGLRSPGKKRKRPRNIFINTLLSLYCLVVR